MLLGVSANALGPLESINDCIEFLWPPYGKVGSCKVPLGWGVVICPGGLR